MLWKSFIWSLGFLIGGTCSCFGIISITIDSSDPWTLDLGESNLSLQNGQVGWGSVPFVGDPDYASDFATFDFSFDSSGDVYTGTGFLSVFGVTGEVQQVVLDFQLNDVSGEIAQLVITGSSMDSGAFDDIGNFRLAPLFPSDVDEMVVATSAIPEPSTYALWLGSLTFAWMIWSRKRRRA